MYSLLLLLSLCSTWLFSRCLLREKSFLPLVIVNILLIYTHYFGWFVLTAEVVSFIVLRPKRWRAASTMALISSLAFLPWMIAVLQAAGAGSGLKENIGWMARPGIVSVVTLITNLIEPFHYQASSAEPFTIFSISIPLFLIVAAGAVIYIARFSNIGQGERSGVYLLGFFTAVPLVLAFVLSWISPYSVWGTRHLIVVFAPFTILLAIVLMTGPKVLNIASAVLIAVLSCYAVILKETTPAPQYSWCAWEPLVAPAAQLSPSVPVYAVEDLVAYHVWFALRKNTPGLEVGRIRGLDVREDTAYFLPRGFESIGSVAVSEINKDRFWLAYRRSSTSAAEAPLQKFLDHGYTVDDRRELAAGREIAVLLLLRR
jgi:hypothetical protein